MSARLTKTRPDGTPLAAAVPIAIAIVCLDACAGGPSGCSGSRGCGGCQRDRDDRNDNVLSRPVAARGSSTPTTRALPEAITTPSGSEPTRVVDLPPPASGISLEIYPPPPIGHPSRAFRVRVGGKPAYVERYRDVSYVRFAFEGSIDLDIDVDAPITTHHILPAEAVSASTRSGSTLRLSLSEPSSLVVWIDDLEKLFVLADPIEAAPVAGADGVISVADAGAAANAPGVATAAFQSAIDAASTTPGGGTVLFPPGRHVAGVLRVKSNVTLYLAAGALLEGSPDPGDDFLLVDQASSVRIRGRGAIDGQGSIIHVRESQNVIIEDVMLRDSAAWAVHLVASRGALLRNVKVLNDPFVSGVVFE